MEQKYDELYHYGVLGMKWGVHRRKKDDQEDKEKNKSSAKSDIDKDRPRVFEKSNIDKYISGVSRKSHGGSGGKIDQLTTDKKKPFSAIKAAVAEDKKRVSDTIGFISRSYKRVATLQNKIKQNSLSSKVKTTKAPLTSKPELSSARSQYEDKVVKNFVESSAKSKLSGLIKKAAKSATAAKRANSLIKKYSRKKTYPSTDKISVKK